MKSRPRASFTASFRNEHKLLQREQTGGSPAVVALAYSVVVGIALGLLALLAWALHRLSFGAARRAADASVGASGRWRSDAAPRRRLILPLAHHNAVAALPVFAPALVICLVLLVHRLRHRDDFEDDEEEELS